MCRVRETPARHNIRIARLLQTQISRYLCLSHELIINNKQICIAPLGHNFRGAGARQHVNEQRKERKPGRRGMSEVCRGVLYTDSVSRPFTTIYIVYSSAHSIGGHGDKQLKVLKSTFSSTDSDQTWHTPRRIDPDVLAHGKFP